MLMLVMISTVSCEEDAITYSMEDVSSRVQNLSSYEPFHEDPLTISGAMLDEVVRVFIGNVEITKANFTEQTESSISLIVPATTATGETKLLIVWSGSGRANIDIEVKPKPTPQILTFSAYAGVGEDLTITGQQLDNNTKVTVDEVNATIVSVSDTELVVTVPNGVDTSGPISFEVTTDYGTTSPNTAFYAMHNFLVNSELEQGEGDEFTGWDKLNGGETMTQVTGEAAYGGGRSIRVVPAGGNPWDRQFASTPTPLTFGEEYTVVLWAKAEETGAAMRVSVSQYDGNGADYFYGADQEFTTEWAQYTWTFTVTNDLPEHRLVLDMGAYSAPFLLDHIALVQGSVGEGASGASEELMNGSFEDGLTGWTVLNGAGEVSTGEAYCGSQSLTATGTGGNPWDVQIASNHIEGITAGSDYEVGFWAKAAGPDGVFRVSMSQYNSGDGSDFFYSPDLEIPEDWTYFSFVLEDVPTVASGEYKLLFDMGVSTQTFFIDGVSIKEYEVAVGLNENGGFEDGLTGWTSLNGAHETSTAEAHSGTASLTATGTGGNPWDVQMATNPLDMQAGNTYKISFWAKAAGADGIFRISMSQYNSGDGSDFFYSSDLEIPEDWSYFSFVLADVPTVASGEYKLLFDMGVSTQTFFVDDVSVVEYETCE